MRVVRFSNLDELNPWADDWDRLASGVPFRSWTWLSHWWRHYGRRHRLAVLGVFDDADALQGLAPWYLDRSTLSGRVLRQLGSGEVCSDYLGLLAQPASEEAVIEAIAEYLAGDDGGRFRWDLLDLDGIDADDRVTGALVQALAIAGCTVHRRSELNCWRLELPVDWDSYVASLGKNLRRDLHRLERDLVHTNRVKLHPVDCIDDLPKAMAILVTLHQRRREMLGERGCFASPEFLGFHRDVAPELLRHGQAQFFWMELDGRPVAAEYLLAGNGILYAYQSGVDPTVLQHQPGKLNNLAIVRAAIEQGYRALDFLRGDEPYKARFGARPRPSLQWRIVPSHPVAKARHNLWLAGRELKHLGKRGLETWTKPSQAPVPNP